MIYVLGFDKNGTFCAGCVYKDDNSANRPKALNSNVVLTEVVGQEVFDLYKQGYYRNSAGVPTKPEVVAPTFEEVKAEALSRIDSATSGAILGGFEYEVKLSTGNEVLYFSYDSFDQQNFADTANGAMMQMMAIPTSLPTVIEWNGWRNHTAESKGELVKVPLKADQFVSLYTEGALAHKAYQMEIGTSRKQEIEACQTADEINALLSEWGI